MCVIIKITSSNKTNAFALLTDKVLGVLGLNLELKSKGYEVPALSCVFMLNNYHYIHKSLTR